MTLSKQKIQFFLIMCAVFINQINYILYNTNIYTGEQLKFLFRIFCFAILVYSVFVYPENISIKPRDILLFVLLIYPILQGNNIALNIALLMIYAIVLKHHAPGKIMHWFLICSICCFGIYLMFLFSGFAKNVTYTIGLRQRNTMGFNNVNSYSVFIFSLMSLISLRVKNNFLFSSLSVAVCVGTFFLTDTRTLIFCMLLLMGFRILLKAMYHIKVKKVYISGILFFIALPPILFSVFIKQIYRIYPHLDIILSQRITLFYKWIIHNSWRELLFGATSEKLVDNSYLVMVYSIGLFSFLLLFSCIFYRLFTLNQKSSWTEIAYVLSYLYYAASESVILRPELIGTLCFWLIVMNIFSMEGHRVKEIKSCYNGWNKAGDYSAVICDEKIRRE